MFAGRRAEPVADLQVGDEAAGHREGRADHAADDQRGGHAGRAAQSDAHQHQRREDQRHECHARYGVRADDGDGVGRNGREEEGDDEDDHETRDRLHPAVEQAEVEEDEDRDERGDEDRQDALHRDVALRALGRFGSLLPASEFRDGEAHGLADDLRLADDADDAGHGDAADAERFADEGEEVLGREERLGMCQQIGVRHAEHRGHGGGVRRSGQRADHRDDDEPHEA